MTRIISLVVLIAAIAVAVWFFFLRGDEEAPVVDTPTEEVMTDDTAVEEAAENAEEAIEDAEEAVSE